MKPGLFSIAIFIAATPVAAHDPMQWNGSEIHVLLERAETDGDMGMFTTRFSEPGGPPRHVHEDAGEALYVLEGEAEFLKGEDRVVLGEGEVVFVPAGVDHTFRILEENGGQLLVIVTPGGFERFFEATLDLALPEQMEAMNRISEDDFKQVFTGPPLGAE